MEIEFGKTRVKVTNNTTRLFNQKKKFIGYEGTVVRGRGFQLIIKFDDPEIQKMNESDGTWLWDISELEVVTTPRIETCGNVKVIYSYPVIVYIINHGKRYVKGVARLMEGDEYDEQKGLAIARLRAEIKEKEYRLKKLCE